MLYLIGVFRAVTKSFHSVYTHSWKFVDCVHVSLFKSCTSSLLHLCWRAWTTAEPSCALMVEV